MVGYEFEENYVDGKDIDVMVYCFFMGLFWGYVGDCFFDDFGLSDVCFLLFVGNIKVY